MDKWQHKEHYPRISKQDAAMDHYTFKERYKTLGRGQSKPDDEVVVRGMYAFNFQVKSAHASKEEFGHFELQARSWDSLTCSKTFGPNN